MISAIRLVEFPSVFENLIESGFALKRVFGLGRSSIDRRAIVSLVDSGFNR